MTIDSTRLVSETIEVQLDIVDSTGTPVDSDAVPSAQVCVYDQVQFEIPSSAVTQVSTGVYRFSFDPTTAALHVVNWFWVYGGEDNTSTYKIDVIANPQGTVSDDAPVAPVAAPDIGADQVCVVTGQFYDASGNGLEGIYVRFTPLSATDTLESFGFVQEVTASSDLSGALSITLPRGVRGRLAVSGVGVVRDVEVPNVATYPIESLLATGESQFTVQTPEFTSLPRTS